MNDNFWYEKAKERKKRKTNLKNKKNKEKKGKKRKMKKKKEKKGEKKFDKQTEFLLNFDRLRNGTTQTRLQIAPEGNAIGIIITLFQSDDAHWQWLALIHNFHSLHRSKNMRPYFQLSLLHFEICVLLLCIYESTILTVYH